MTKELDNTEKQVTSATLINAAKGRIETYENAAPKLIPCSQWKPTTDYKYKKYNAFTEHCLELIIGKHRLQIFSGNEGRSTIGVLDGKIFRIDTRTNPRSANKQIADEMQIAIRSTDGEKARLETAVTFNRNTDVDLDKIKKNPKFTAFPEGTIGVARIDKKSMQQVQDSFDLLQSINNKLDGLRQASAQLEYNFKGDNKAKALLKQTTELKEAYEKQAEKAKKLLKTIGEEKEPPSFLAMVKNIMETTRNELEAKFSEASQYVYVTQVREENRLFLEFTHYVDFKSLEANGFVYPEYYIVFTCRITPDGRSPHYYVNTLHKFRIPGAFRKGSEFKDTHEGSKKLAAILTTDSFIESGNRKPISMTTDELKSGDLGSNKILHVSVENDKIVFALDGKLNEKQLQTEVNYILGSLRGALSLNKSAHIRYTKPEHRGEAWRLVVVVLGGNDKSARLRPHDIDMLKERFDLDDEDMRTLIKALDKGHV